MSRGGARPPILVLAMGAAFALLVVSLLIGSLTKPELPPYTPTALAPLRVGDSLAGPATYTLDASATELIGRVTGRATSLLGGAVEVPVACGPVAAELMPTATTAQPATASDAAAPATRRTTDMGPVCQV